MTSLHFIDWVGDRTDSKGCVGCRGFRRIGAPVWMSFLSIFVIHGTFSYWTLPSWIPDPSFPIYTDKIHRVTLTTKTQSCINTKLLCYPAHLGQLMLAQACLCCNGDQAFHCVKLTDNTTTCCMHLVTTLATSAPSVIAVLLQCCPHYDADRPPIWVS